MTMMTVYYSCLWLFMMVIGGACYEQRIIVKKHGKKLPTLALAGWCLVIVAMLGFVHGILGFFHLIAL